MGATDVRSRFGRAHGALLQECSFRGMTRAATDAELLYDEQLTSRCRASAGGSAA